jgi:hypothetical protein
MLVGYGCKQEPREWQVVEQELREQLSVGCKVRPLSTGYTIVYLSHVNNQEELRKSRNKIEKNKPNYQVRPDINNRGQRTYGVNRHE